ncbi:TRAP transporter small permease [Oceanobacillus longus]|uniref:TRAP transporter small permease n=1 Tax=Oceanobacillus longus TaxID=930120 RepID=A0ABV8H4N4_9BACI
MLFFYFNRILTFVENILAAIGCILLFGMTFSIIFEIFSRAFFGTSYYWINEINEYMLLYLTFLGGAYVLRNNGHVTVDILDTLLSETYRKYSKILIYLLGIIVCLVLVYYGTLVTLDAFARDLRSTSLLAYPQAYIYIAIPVGSLIMLLEFCRKILALQFDSVKE